jgi:hypothetical protein
MLPERAPNNVLQMSSLLISSGCFLCVSFDPNAHLPFLCFVLFLSAWISPQPGAESYISRLDLAPGLCFQRRTSRNTGMAQNYHLLKMNLVPAGQTPLIGCLIISLFPLSRFNTTTWRSASSVSAYPMTSLPLPLALSPSSIPPVADLLPCGATAHCPRSGAPHPFCFVPSHSHICLASSSLLSLLLQLTALCEL